MAGELLEPPPGPPRPTIDPDADDNWLRRYLEARGGRALVEQIVGAARQVDISPARLRAARRRIGARAVWANRGGATAWHAEQEVAS